MPVGGRARLPVIAWVALALRFVRPDEKYNHRLQVFSLTGEHRRSIMGEWRSPARLCFAKDRLYLVEREHDRDDNAPIARAPNSCPVVAGRHPAVRHAPKGAHGRVQIDLLLRPQAAGELHVQGNCALAVEVRDTRATRPVEQLRAQVSWYAELARDERNLDRDAARGIRFQGPAG